MKAFASRFLQSLGLLGAALVIGNLLALLMEWAPYGALEDGRGPVGLYEDKQSPNDRIRLRAGTSLNGLLYDIGINSDGLRGPELRQPKPEDGLRLWCAGGSSTFDIYAPDDASTWPARLEHHLAQGLPSRSVEVINGGVPGENLWGNLRAVEELAPKLQPDILIIHQGPNEVRRALSAPPSPHGSAQGRRPALLRVLARWHFRLSPPAAEPGLRLEEPHLATARRNMREAIQVGSELGLELVLASHATAAGTNPSSRKLHSALTHDAAIMMLTPEEDLRAITLYNGMVRSLAEEEGLLFVDLAAAVPGEPRYWGDGTHFSAEGSDLAARVVAEALLASGIGDAP
jgi:lysophospholipase L1-like esterase